MLDTKTLLKLLKEKGLLETLQEKGLSNCPIKPDDPYAYSPAYTDIYDTDEETMRIEHLSTEELKKYIQEQTERLKEMLQPRK